MNSNLYRVQIPCSHMLSRGAIAEKSIKTINLELAKEKEGKLEIEIKQIERNEIPKKYEPDEITFFEKLAIENIKRHTGPVEKEIIKKYVHENITLSSDYVNNIPLSVYKLISDSIAKFSYTERK